MIPNADLVLYAHVVLAVLTCLSIAKKYRSYGYLIVFDSRIYFLSLLLLYVSVPSIHYYYVTSGYNESLSTQTFISGYGLYFIFVQFCFFFTPSVLKLLSEDSKRKLPCCESSGLSTRILVYLMVLISLYVLGAFFVSGGGQVRAFWLSRGYASAFRIDLDIKYKITFCYAVVVLIVSYLSLIDKKLIYTWFFFPFVFIDLVLSDRSYIFIACTVGVFFFVSVKRKIPVLSVLACLMFLIFIGIVREESARVGGVNMFQVPREFLFTYISNFIVFDYAGSSLNLPENVVKSLLLIFPGLDSLLGLSEIATVSGTISENSPFLWGLGGSLLAEAFLFGPAYALVFPFLVAFYLQLINKLLVTKSGLGYFLFVSYLFSLSFFFRGGFLTWFMLPLYYVVYSGFWYWWGMFMKSRGKHRFV